MTFPFDGGAPDKPRQWARPIRKEADYEAALARADVLMGAEPGTSEGRELDVLTDRIEDYEAARWPMEADRPEDEAVDAIESCLGDCQCESPMARTWPDGAVTCRVCGRELGRWKGGEQ